jgi:hypothetical protein
MLMEILLEVPCSQISEIRLYFQLVSQLRLTLQVRASSAQLPRQASLTSRRLKTPSL